MMLKPLKSIYLQPYKLIIICFPSKDNGIGKYLQTTKNVYFTIFQRLHSHNEYEGSSIGLAIAQKNSSSTWSNYLG